MTPPPPPPPPAPPAAVPAARHRYDTLVLSGGGAKGLAALGAVNVLARAGYLDGVDTFVGTSAGALVAASLAVRMAPCAAVRAFCSRRFKPDPAFTNFGIDGGESLDAWIRAVVGDLTLRDVRERHGSTLVVCVTNLSEARAEYFHPDTHPDVPARDALRMSCAIPLVFSAVRFRGALYVDGALTNNFPLEYARGLRDPGREGREGREKNRESRVLGVHVVGRPGSVPIATYGEYLAAVTRAVVQRPVPPSRHVLALRVSDASAVDLDLHPSAVKSLFNSGARQAREFVKKNA